MDARGSIQKSEYDCSSDESGEIKIVPQRPTEAARKQNKNGILWKEMLEEESLMVDMKTVGINLRKRKIDRGTETYEYDEDQFEREKRPRSDQKFVTATCSAFPARKEHSKGTLVDKSPKYLDELINTESMTDDQFIEHIARILNEENVELIKKVLTAVGREGCAEFYNKTRKMEANGGLLTVNKARRRTSGGIFLFLVKTSNKITHEQKDAIFKQDHTQ